MENNNGSASIATSKKDKFFFRGWSMVAVTFVVAIVTQGLGLYSFGVIKLPITEELGLSATSVAAGFSSYNIALALTCLIVGDLIDRIGIRPVMLLSAVFFAGGFVLLSFAETLLML
jgi:MFS family permease